jgi:hypothetical protein
MNTDGQRAAIQALVEYLAALDKSAITRQQLLARKARFLVDYFHITETDIGKIREAYAETYTD